MVSLDAAKSLLAASLDNNVPPERDHAVYHPLHRFVLEANRQYQQQFADMYFLRLAKIKPAVEAVASHVFGDVVVGDTRARKVERVLDVRQGELCWVSGTVYMDMPFKPSILDDVSQDKLLSKPAAVDKYIPEDDDLLAEGRGSVAILLEDDSGRIRLVGRALGNVLLATGCIVAVMGTENEDGELEVLDIVFPDVPPQPERWSLSKSGGGRGRDPVAKKTRSDGDVAMDVDTTSEQTNTNAPSTGTPRSKKVAIVSGLNFSGPHAVAAIETNLLLEYLLGESVASGDAAHISRLIVAGNSIVAHDSPEAQRAQADTALTAAAAEAHSKKYGYDSSSYNPQPSRRLDAFLAQLLPSLPVTLLPGAHDIANASLPQQPIHSAMFPKSRVYTAPTPSGGWFDPVTNPWEGEIDGWRVLGTSGQTMDDIAKYVQDEDRLNMMEATCRWRCAAPTAPDTLWSYPYQEDDPFVLDSCPHVYFAGSQPAFGTRLMSGPDGQTVRLIAVPAFSETREVVLLDTETLDVSVIKVERQ